MSKITEIADHYGQDAQLGMLTEECAELIQAVNKYKRLGDNASQEDLEKAYVNLEEELADVEIMSKQILYLLGFDRTIYDHIKEEKLNRTLSRIAKEPKGTKFREYTCPHDKNVMCDMTSPCDSCVMSKGAIRV